MTLATARRWCPTTLSSSGAFPPTKFNDHLNTVTGKSIQVLGQIMLEATFNDNKCYFDCLVTDGLNNEILVSWHDAVAIGAVKFAQSKRKLLISKCGHVKQKKNAFVQETSENIEKMKQYFREKYPDVLKDKLPTDYGMRGPKVSIKISPDCPSRPRKALTASPGIIKKSLDRTEIKILQPRHVRRKTRRC